MLRILNLIIFSDNVNEMYEEMYKCLSELYKLYEEHTDVYVKTVYMKYTEDNNILKGEEFFLDNNILYIRGTESFLPGVLLKTLKGFRYFEKDIYNYDYVIRSNISTIINFKLLAEELRYNPIKFYGGGHKRNLQWLGGGITDSKWFGTDYIEGTSIIFSIEAIKYILDNINLVRKDIIDDLAFAILIREHRPDVIVQDLNPSKYAFVPCFLNNNHIDANAIIDMVLNNKIIFYRNKCCQYREIDLIQMNIISNILKNNI
jgi:hypothetical protein